MRGTLDISWFCGIVVLRVVVSSSREAGFVSQRWTRCVWLNPALTKLDVSQLLPC